MNITIFYRILSPTGAICSAPSQNHSGTIHTMRLLNKMWKESQPLDKREFTIQEGKIKWEND